MPEGLMSDWTIRAVPRDLPASPLRREGVNVPPTRPASIVTFSMHNVNLRLSFIARARSLARHGAVSRTTAVWRNAGPDLDRTGPLVAAAPLGCPDDVRLEMSSRSRHKLLEGQLEVTVHDGPEVLGTAVADDIVLTAGDQLVRTTLPRRRVEQSTQYASNSTSHSFQQEPQNRHLGFRAAMPQANGNAVADDSRLRSLAGRDSPSDEAATRRSPADRNLERDHNATARSRRFRPMSAPTTCPPIPWDTAATTSSFWPTKGWPSSKKAS